ncbi:hypothetical protein ZHAS_00017514 [Anopheles sinensis]|uniref:Uncharacterized protein n=1 Tax=Anopheles sinensis TaxID=74873 RepID=A0A084WGR8_ANOSI|nr:hypothetical protein ZHAS_00017514 [Anopheles sinensis]
MSAHCAPKCNVERFPVRNGPHRCFVGVGLKNHPIRLGTIEATMIPAGTFTEGFFPDRKAQPGCDRIGAPE